ncbi:MAG: hypothetical protein ACI82H_000077 [Alphaproteobacteria bacterium]|jgi:hypothetical protein
MGRKCGIFTHSWAATVYYSVSGGFPACCAGLPGPFEAEI